jgi:hypothetical protein
MKIRNGFVSNSSSNSFLAIGTKEVFDAALAECNMLEKMLANNFITNDTFLGRDVCSFYYFDGGDGPCGNIEETIDAYYEEANNVDEESMDDKRDNAEMFIKEIFPEKLEAKAKELGENLITRCEDM